MRPVALLAVFLAAAACATGGGSASSGPEGGGALTADLLPFDASTAQFVDLKDSVSRTLRVVPTERGDGVRLLLDAPGEAAREIRVARRDASIYFSGDADSGTELLRLGARPGDTWESGGRRVAFEGWERVPVAAVLYDAARISARRGPAGLEHVETWWFTRGKGVVRLKSDHGALFVDELARSSP